MIRRIKNKKPVLKKLLPAKTFFAGRRPRVSAGFLFVASLVVFVLSSLVWAYLGAKLNMQNADQVVNPYMFEDAKTFDRSIFPSQHSFFIKWPLFMLVKLFGYSATVYIAATVFCVAVTLAVLAVIIVKIEKRPEMRSIIFLALSSILLLTPPQPYPGGLLPANMAMLTTRNLEYALYMLAVLLLLKAKRLKSYASIGAIATLTLLFASDKLFQSMSLVAAFAALVLYSWRKYWDYVTDASHWLITSLISAIAATGLLAGLSVINPGIISHASINPYDLVSSPKAFVLGVGYAGLDILTNMGANPGNAAQTIAQLPHAALKNIFSPAGPAFLVNGLVFVFVSLLILELVVVHFRRSSASVRQPYAERYTIVMLWTALAALPLFIATNHQYVVDARYLAIWFFALVIGATVRLRALSFSRNTYKIICVTLAFSVLSGFWYAVHFYNTATTALHDTATRDSKVISAIREQHIDVLAGDYWRVVPVRQKASKSLHIVSLQTCSQERSLLTSQQWSRSAQPGKFAYLLTMDGSLTDFPNCTFLAIENIYGTPDSSTVIAGSIEKPKELLLIYDGHKARPKQATPATASAAQSLVPSLPNAECGGPTIVNVVAHQDDDLLFMNPDTERAIKEGFCVRTIYITAGDAGGGQMYWLAREHGSREAYSEMIGKADRWNLQDVSVGQRAMVTVATPVENKRISLVFLRLPDGNLRGEGFSINRDESLAALYGHIIDTLQSVDGQSTYTADELKNTIAALLAAYQPTLVRTQSSINSNAYEDHSDHQTTGKFATEAYRNYAKTSNQKSKIAYYVGYPVRDRPSNVSKADYKDKLTAFLSYAKYDPSVCSSVVICYQTATYNDYLHREYQNSK